MFITLTHIFADYFCNREKRVSPNDALLSFFAEYSNCENEYLWEIRGYIEYIPKKGFRISNSPNDWHHYLDCYTYGELQYEYEEFGENIDQFIFGQLEKNLDMHKSDYFELKKFIENSNFTKYELMKMAYESYKYDKNHDELPEIQRGMIQEMSHLPALDLQSLFL